MSENTISTQDTSTLQDAAEVQEDAVLSAEQEQLCKEVFPLQETDSIKDSDLPQVEYEQQQTTENPPEEAVVELTVYGQKVAVTQSEARAAAQKGMAFEHVKQQLAQAKNDPRLKALEEVALIKGVTVSQLVDSLHSSAVTDRLVQQYGSIEAAPWQAVNDAVKAVEKHSAQIAAAEKTAQQLHWKSQLREFLENNPGCTDIPQQVLQMAKQGHRLTDAYAAYQNSVLSQQLADTRQELDMFKSQSQAAKRATPSARSTMEQGSETNKFLELMKSTW